MLNKETLAARKKLRKKNKKFILMNAEKIAERKYRKTHPYPEKKVYDVPVIPAPKKIIEHKARARCSISSTSL